MIQKLAIAAPENTTSQLSFVSVSLGIASQIPKLNHLPNQLIDQADQALYLAKKKGRNTWMVYEGEKS